MGAGMDEAGILVEERHGRVGGAEVLVCDHRVHAGERERGAGIDAREARLGVWASQHRRVQHLRQVNVIDEARAPGEQPFVLAPLDRLPDQPGGHGSSPRSSGRSPAHGRHDLLVSGAAAEVARERLPDLGVARRRVCGKEGFQGHQDAGGAITALQAVLAAEGLLQRVQRVAVRQRFHRLDRGAVRLHRKHQAGAHRGAVQKHGAGAADAVLAAHVGAGKSRFVPDEVREQEPGLDPVLVSLAVDGDAHVAAMISHSAPHPHGRLMTGALGERGHEPLAVPGWRVGIVRRLGGLGCGIARRFAGIGVRSSLRQDRLRHAHACRPVPCAGDHRRGRQCRWRCCRKAAAAPRPPRARNLPACAQPLESPSQYPPGAPGS